MSTALIEIAQDLTALLKQFKSKNEASKELALKQLTTYLNNNREYTDEIIEEMSKFFDSEKESIEETDLYKIINNICSILEMNYLSTTKFINKIFPILMLRIYYYSQNKPKDDSLLFNIISELTKKCENNAGQIEFTLNTVFEKLRDVKNSPDDSTKYALISVLEIFLHNAPVISFSKIMKSTNGFKTIISDFNHRDENIRKAIQKLIEEFLLILLNKDSHVRKQKSESIIYDMCIKDYIDKKNNTEFTIHGLVLVLQSFTAKKDDKINEFFKEKFKLFLDFLFSNIFIDKNYIKISVIEALSSFCEFFPCILEEKEIIDYGNKIFNALINIYSDKRTDENIKSEILKCFGKLCLIETIKEPCSDLILNFTGTIRNDIIEKNTFNENILDCISDFFKFYKDACSAVFPFNIYYDKMFSSGLKNNHINFLKNLLIQYEKDSKDHIQIVLCILNVISFIITEKEFTFNNTKKKFSITANNNESANGLSLNIIEPSTNKFNINLSGEDILYFNNAGKAISNYIKEKKKKYQKMKL